MDIKDQLDSLRQSIEGCGLAAFADVGARLVLVASSEPRAAREVLDALCAEAAGLFEVADAKADGGLSGADTAMTHDAAGIRLFLRDSVGGSDVLCLVLQPGASLAPALEVAQIAADEIFDQSGDA